MSLGIGSLGSTSQARFESANRPARTAADPADPATFIPPPDRVELSSTPPPEVRDEVDFAFERALELAAQNRELHFARDEETGRVYVQVRDLDGNVIRTIPNGEVFDVMAGAEL